MTRGWGAAGDESCKDAVWVYAKGWVLHLAHSIQHRAQTGVPVVCTAPPGPLLCPWATAPSFCQRTLQCVPAKSRRPPQPCPNFLTLSHICHTTPLPHLRLPLLFLGALPTVRASQGPPHTCPHLPTFAQQQFLLPLDALRESYTHARHFPTLCPPAAPAPFS